MGGGDEGDSPPKSGDYDEQTFTMKLLPKLDASQASDQVYRSLVTIRCKYSVHEHYRTLMEESGLVEKLIPLLQRPNSKIVDMSLSVLGNILMYKVPREQVR